MRNRAASEMMRCRWMVVELSGITTKPMFGSRPSSIMRRSMSAVARDGIGVVHECYAAEIGCDLLEGCEQLAGDRGGKIGEARGVAARPGYARGDPAADWIADDHEYDRNGPGGLDQRFHNRGAVADDDVGLKPDQLFRKGPHAVGIAGGKTIFDPQVLPDGPSLLLESVLENLDTDLRFRIVCQSHQNPDGPNPFGPLGARRDRPHCGRADQKSREPASSDANCHRALCSGKPSRVANGITARADHVKAREDP